MEYDFLKNVVFFRHGETEWNAKKMIQGWLDSPLTERGIQETKNAIPALAQYDFKKIISSPAGRTFQTAKIIAETLGIANIEINDNFAERGFGKMEGMTKEQAIAGFPELWDEKNRFSQERETPSGETIEQIYKRILLAVEYLAKEARSEKVLVTTHDTFLKFFASYITKTSIRETKNKDFPHCEPIIFDEKFDLYDCL